MVSWFVIAVESCVGPPEAAQSFFDSAIYLFCGALHDLRPGLMSDAAAAICPRFVHKRRDIDRFWNEFTPLRRHFLHPADLLFVTALARRALRRRRPGPTRHGTPGPPPEHPALVRTAVSSVDDRVGTRQLQHFVRNQLFLRRLQLQQLPQRRALAHVKYDRQPRFHVLLIHAEGGRLVLLVPHALAHSQQPCFFSVEQSSVFHVSVPVAQDERRHDVHGQKAAALAVRDQELLEEGLLHHVHIVSVLERRALPQPSVLRPVASAFWRRPAERLELLHLLALPLRLLLQLVRKALRVHQVAAVPARNQRQQHVHTHVHVHVGLHPGVHRRQGAESGNRVQLGHRQPHVLVLDQSVQNVCPVVPDGNHGFQFGLRDVRDDCGAYLGEIVREVEGAAGPNVGKVLLELRKVHKRHRALLRALAVLAAGARRSAPGVLLAGVGRERHGRALPQNSA
mmetsp:Transcript_279/g.477  ORF Transcript_279/g.477 Transcript_279/m.477 type:complete len:453 (+) Transcript_279:518-1876(+)